MIKYSRSYKKAKEANKRIAKKKYNKIEVNNYQKPIMFIVYEISR